RLWPITAELYGRMIEAGVFGRNDRAYLWKGRLAAKITKYRPHCIATKNVYDALMALRLSGFSVEQETPMALREETSVPGPDMRVIRALSEQPAPGFITSADVPLVIEVSESTLDDNRHLAFAYALETIPISRLVNIRGRRIEVFSEPA